MNIIEYVKTATETFSERPFCPVDSLVLSQMSYCRLEAVLHGEGRDVQEPKYALKDFCKSEYFDEMFCDGINDPENLELFLYAVSSRRFRDLRVKHLVVECDDRQEKQFAAMTFELDAATDYLAFRGTDGTILGWKEDFNMAFMDEIPSQAEAVRYIDRFYGGWRWPWQPKKRLYVGGHSKGGNLAVYGALQCEAEIRARIVEVFSHDGPGFRDEVADRLEGLRTESDLKISKQVPQTSLVGILMESREHHRVVKSDGALFAQHAAFAWRIADNDFEYLEELSQSGEYVERTMSRWLQTVEDEKRAFFINTLYDVLLANNILTLHDLKAMTPRKVMELMESVKGLDEETRSVLRSVIKSFAAYAVRSISDRKEGEEQGSVMGAIGKRLESVGRQSVNGIKEKVKGKKKEN